MIQIAVCDDERAEVSYQSAMVRHWTAERGVAAKKIIADA